MNEQTAGSGVSITQEDVNAAEARENEQLQQHVTAYLNQRVCIVSAELDVTKKRLDQETAANAQLRAELEAEREAHRVLERNPEVRPEPETVIGHVTSTD